MLYVTTAGTEKTRFGQLLSVDTLTGAVETLLNGLQGANAVAVVPLAGDASSGGAMGSRVFFLEGAEVGQAFVGKGALSEYLDGNSKRCLRELPFAPQGGLVALDADCRRFAVGSFGRSCPGTGGGVYVVPTEAADGEPWLSISGGLAANEALALDNNGCLYCAGAAGGKRPGIEAFPGFVTAAERGVPAVMRACADEQISVQRPRGRQSTYQAVKGLTVSPGGDTVYYSTVRDALRLGRIRPAA
jgi:hypothetical protein